jgi:hypothetical protein
LLLLLQEIPLVAPNPNLCTDFVEMRKVTSYYYNNNNNIYPSCSPKGLNFWDSQQGERTVPQGKLPVLHSPSSPTQNTTKKETLGQFLGSFFVLSRTQC